MLSAKFKSLFADPRLSPFYSPPLNQLRLHYDEEKEREAAEVAVKTIWPDTEMLFENCTAYCKTRQMLTTYIDKTLKMVVNYSEVNFSLKDIVKC